MALPNKRGAWAVLWAAVLSWPAAAMACPFCSGVSKTLSEEIGSSDAVVLARLLPRSAKAAEAADNAPVTAPDESAFEITKVLKGADALGKTRQIKILYFGQQPKGTQFLVFGIDPKNWAWTTPTPLDERSAKYVTELIGLPEKGAERLAFFQEYLEDANSVLANDAYDEFARAPYAEVKELREKMHRDRLLDWIQDTEVAASRRRLYLTMLGICGQPDDVAILEGMLKSSDRQYRNALDAMIACYVILKGPEGMPLVEDLFLKNKDAEYPDTYAAIMALRFLGQESDVVSKERLLAGLRYMLDRPQLADLVIADLARWQDWSVMDKLVTLFKQADDESSWVRVPVVNYLRACPKPEAKQHLAELAKLDPDAVKRANSFFPLGTASPAAVAKPAAGKSADDKAAGSKKPDAKAPAAGKTEKPARAKADVEKTPPAKTGAGLSPQDAGAALAMLNDGDVSASKPASRQDAVAPSNAALSNVAQSNAEQGEGPSQVAAAGAVASLSSAAKAEARLAAKKAAAKEVGSATLIGFSFGIGACLFCLQWAILRNNRDRVVG